MQNGMFEEYPIPAEALADLRKQNRQLQTLDNGVNFLAATEEGLAVRFDTIHEKNLKRSDAEGWPVFEDVELMYIRKDRDNEFPFRIKGSKVAKWAGDVPDSWFIFDRNGSMVGGLFKPAYDKWKSGQKLEGTTLRSWGVLSACYVKSLEEDGIWTVEQFASFPRSRFEGGYPVQFQQAHDAAKAHVAGKDIRDMTAQNAAKFDSLESENSRLKAQMEAMQQQMAALMGSPVEQPQAAPKKRGRPRKQELLTA